MTPSANPFPKKQFVVARTRGGSTRYFYGDRLKDILRDHIKNGERFIVATYTRGAKFAAVLVGDRIDTRRMR